MKKLFLLSLSASICVVSNAQLINDGASIVVQNGATIYAQDFIENETNGEFYNSGKIYLEGDWINNGGNTMLVNNLPGSVNFVGGNPQRIEGPNFTEFYDLILDPVPSIKSLNVDATVVTNKLDLKSSELQTERYGITLTNPSPDSLLWDANAGFISGRDLGSYIARNMNSTSTYVFPVGNSNLNNIYRPVEITPTTGENAQYGVRLGLDATYDMVWSTSMSGYGNAYDRSVKSQLIKEVNDDFYHNIFRFIGNNPSNIKVHYFSTDVDNSGDDFVTLSQWQDVSTSWQTTSPSWEDAQFVVTNNTAPNPTLNSPDKTASKLNVTDFYHDGFGLSTVNDLVLIPQLITPLEVDGLNDVWEIENIEYFPNNQLRVFNRYGNLVYQKDGYLNTWDGKPNVNQGINMLMGNGYLPSGTYFYTLDLGVAGLETYVGQINIRQ